MQRLCFFIRNDDTRARECCGRCGQNRLAQEPGSCFFDDDLRRFLALAWWNPEHDDVAACMVARNKVAAPPLQRPLPLLLPKSYTNSWESSRVVLEMTVMVAAALEPGERTGACASSSSWVASTRTWSIDESWRTNKRFYVMNRTNVELPHCPLSSFGRSVSFQDLCVKDARAQVV